MFAAFLNPLDSIKKLKGICDFEKDVFITPKRKFKIFYHNLQSKEKRINNLEINTIDFSKFRMDQLKKKSKLKN